MGFHDCLCGIAREMLRHYEERAKKLGMEDSFERVSLTLEEVLALGIWTAKFIDQMDVYWRMTDGDLVDSKIEEVIKALYQDWLRLSEIVLTKLVRCETWHLDFQGAGLFRRVRGEVDQILLIDQDICDGRHALSEAA